MPQLVEPKTRRWTREEYYQMAELGWFIDQRVELIEGEIVEMPPQKNHHAAAIELTANALRVAFGSSFWVRTQMPLDLSPLSVPDPDVSVVPGSPRGCSEDNPTTALLVVEISQSTLAYDRRRKGSLYARAGIIDYWIVNLIDRQLEVRRNPVPDSSQQYEFGYAEEIILQANTHVTPLAAPQAKIAVADLLP